MFHILAASFFTSNSSWQMAVHGGKPKIHPKNTVDGVAAYGKSKATTCNTSITKKKKLKELNKTKLMSRLVN